MPEGLALPDGTAVNLDPAADAEREFARAMASDNDDSSAPPRRQKPADGEPASRPRRQRPPKSARSAPQAVKKVPSPQSDADRKAGVQGLAQLGAGICLLLDQRTPDSSIAFRADAITLANAAEPIADACVQVARENAQFAAVLDKVTSAGPYAALISVGLSVGAQLARNHGVKAAEMVGARAPETILAELEAAQAQPGDLAA